MAKAAAQKKQDNVVALKRNAPAEDAVKAVNLAKLKRAGESLQAEKNEFQSVAKHVEAKGINLKAASWAIKLQKSGKLEDAVAELTARLEYAYILGVPISKAQLDLFRVEMPRTPSIDRAKEHGRYVGMMGMGMDQNPYSADSEPGQAWIAAFHGGTEERNLVLSMEPAAGSELIAGDDAGGEVFDDEDQDEDEFDAADPNKAAAE